jgi:hypothetical protein
MFVELSYPFSAFFVRITMNLSDDLRRKLKKRYNPDTFTEMKYKGLDLMFRTDDEGNPVVLFIGHRIGENKIKGERYVRTLKKDQEGNVIKDHWDLKGKA